MRVFNKLKIKMENYQVPNQQMSNFVQQQYSHHQQIQSYHQMMPSFNQQITNFSQPIPNCSDKTPSFSKSIKINSQQMSDYSEIALCQEYSGSSRQEPIQNDRIDLVD